MNVVVPYHPACLHPRVIPAIEHQGYVATPIECINEVGHYNSYPMILGRYLTGGEDVCFIEHDNESRPGFLDDLRDCPRPWCYFAYDFSITYEEAISGSSHNSAHLTPTSAPLGEQFAPLGHTRFRAELARHLGELVTSEFFLATWVSRDTLIAETLNAVGILPHRHEGKCFHHHPYSM